MILAIDIGTSNFKAAVFDFDGNRHGFAAESLLINGDASQWIRAFENCREQLRAQTPASLDALNAIEAIVITGNGPTLVPVLEDGSASDARFWFDNSAVKYQDIVSQTMGGLVDAKFFLPKILKIKHEEKELYNRTKHFLGCPEYLAYCLTGRARTVFPLEGFDRWFWNDEALKKMELDEAKFPRFINPGGKFGYMEKYGSLKKIPVISGGPDFYAAILGAGVIKPGQALDRTGSSEGINLCARRKNPDPRLMSYKHPIKPYWNVSGIINKAGLKIEEERKRCGFADINEFLASDKSGRVLEKLCLSLKNIIEVMEETGETSIDELRVTGGLSLNGRYNQMKADITEKKIILVENGKEAELLGCAVTGSCALGKYNSYIEACEKMVKVK